MFDFAKLFAAMPAKTPTDPEDALFLLYIDAQLDGPAADPTGPVCFGPFADYVDAVEYLPEYLRANHPRAFARLLHSFTNSGAEEDGEPFALYCLETLTAAAGPFDTIDVIELHEPAEQQ